PDRFGHVWTSPEVPAYTLTVANQSPAALTGKLLVQTQSFDGRETTRQEHAVPVTPAAVHGIKLGLGTKLYGYRELIATPQLDGKPPWGEKRSFVLLAADARAPRWTEGKGALFGYWSYHGGHYTPKAQHHVALMTRAGARTSIGYVPAGAEWI